MSHFLKTILYIFVTFLIFIGYFIFAESGQNRTYSILSYMLTDEVGLKVKVKEIQINGLTKIRAILELENEYTVKLSTSLGLSNFTIDYTLKGNYLQSNVYTIKDNISIKGKIFGTYDKVKIKGQGILLDGTVTYSLIKEGETYKNILIDIHEISSTKLFRMMGEESHFRGKANSKIYFDYIKKNKKRGHIVYRVKKSNFSGFYSDLELNLNILNEIHHFTFSLLSPEIKIKVNKGIYNQNSKYANARYALNIKELSSLKNILGSTYYGSFSLNGEIDYKTSLRIDGLSHSFGGDFAFNFYQNHIEMQQEAIPIENFFKYIGSSSPIKATLWGHTYYNLTTQYLEMTNQIKNIHFISSALTKAVEKKFEFNLVNEKFPDSSFDIIQSKGILSSDIKIGNKDIFIGLRNTKINTKKRSIKTKLEFHIPKHQIIGNIFARMDQSSTKEEVADTYFNFKGDIDTYYKIKIDGILNDRWVNLDYILHSDRLPSHICTIEDNVSLQGHINGVYSHLHLKTEGELLEGKLLFDATKVGKKLENLSFELKDIHALKLFTLLGYPNLPYGRSDISAKFNTLSLLKKDGTFFANFRDSSLYNLPFTLNTEAKINNNIILFKAKATLPNTNFTLNKGKINLLNNHINTHYHLENSDLSSLKDITGIALNGVFNTQGEVDYNQSLYAKGYTKSFGGILNYRLKDTLLLIDFNSVSLKKFTDLVPSASYLDADIIGKMKFDINNTSMIFTSKLNHARFLPTPLAQTFKEKADVDLLIEVFNQSSLAASFQNNILKAEMILKNEISHLYISNIKVDNNTSKVNAYFDFEMQGQAIAGKIYGTKTKPKINIDFQKILRYQMDKQLDAIMGKKNNKLMEKIPMTNMVKDVTTGMAGSFVGMFF